MTNKPKTRSASPSKASKKKTNDKPESDVDFQKIARSGLHKNNRHKGRYDFKVLTKHETLLQKFVIKNPKGEDSINFSDAQAVKVLNRALLKSYYNVEFWDIPDGYLCPPIPGRADYIHRLAELLESDTQSKVEHSKVRALDIGTGANCIYPIIAASQYQWKVTGSDIEANSVKSALTIVESNPTLKNQIHVVHQANSQQIYKGVIEPSQRYDVTICNPPFHRSAEDAAQGSVRKADNLARNKSKKGKGRPQAMANKGDKSKPALNFGGQHNELWCPGGEASFVKRMANESQEFSAQVLWFTTLISKKDNVRPLRKQLEKLGAKAIRVVEMSQGQKVSRFVAWSYHEKTEREQWFKNK